MRGRRGRDFFALYAKKLPPTHLRTRLIVRQDLTAHKKAHPMCFLLLTTAHLMCMIWGRATRTWGRPMILIHTSQEQNYKSTPVNGGHVSEIMGDGDNQWLRQVCYRRSSKTMMLDGRHEAAKELGNLYGIKDVRF